jgi:hypothetical protein
MPTLTRCQVKFGAALTAGRVESLLSEIPVDDTPRSVELDFSDCDLLAPGAGWRLGNAMSRWGRTGRVRATVPDPGDFSGHWFLAFTRSGLGLALACFADEIRLGDDTDVGDRVRRYYADAGSRSNTNYAVATELPDSTLVEDIDALDEELRRMAVLVGLDFQDLERVARDALREACFEAAENVLDHAFRSPEEPQIDRCLSYLSFGYHRKVNTARFAGEEFRRYLSDLPESLPKDREQRGFVEVVVVDSGCGLAARQSQDPDVYRGKIGLEVAAMEEALDTGGTVKLRVDDSFIRGEPGYGYGYIVEGLRRLNAYAILRTGRCSVTLDATGHDAGWRVDAPLDYLPGTALHLIFPLISNQLHMR